MKLTPQQVAAFQELVWDYFRAHQRQMPWRDNPSPYYVLVSEIMLQQTQVSRVVPKFHDFIEQFPDIQTLAQASLASVLAAWSGLGYNRRAKFLHMAAKMVVTDFAGIIPDSHDDLMRLPGVGTNTAGAVITYAFNGTCVFIETNVRTVYIHHFYHDDYDISDQQIRQLVEQTLDRDNPREFYWALMDYGTHLKQTLPSRNSQSKHYKKQSLLAGSPREMRGRIVRALVGSALDDQTLQNRVDADQRFAPALQALRTEGMIAKRNGKWSLTGADDNR